MKNQKLETIVEGMKITAKIAFVLGYSALFFYIGNQVRDFQLRKYLQQKPLLECYNNVSIKVYPDKVVKDTQTHEEIPLNLRGDNNGTQPRPYTHQI